MGRRRNSVSYPLFPGTRGVKAAQEHTVMKKITQTELDGMLDRHAKWLRGEAGGKQMALYDADLRGLDFCGADMSASSVQESDLREANLRDATLRNVTMRGADLRDADLRGANLRGANLRGADMDYSSGIPLWCGSLGVKADKRLAAQMAYHFCRLECGSPEVKAAQAALERLANKSHVIKMYGLPKIAAENKKSASANRSK